VAITASVLYLATDVVEAAQGGFSASQLWLTLVAEAAIPPVVIGLAVAQRPHLPWFGRIGAWAYAYSFVFFTGTVVYALVRHTPDYATLSRELGAWMLIHGAVMVLAGIAFGLATVRAAWLPRWAAIALAVGVVLVAATQGSPEYLQLTAAAVRDIGIAGMGAALLTGAVRVRN
jgi:hypothetical protein